MQMAIGLDRVISTADTITVFAMQIGVTRIGAGGRTMPRCKSGAMTSVANLVARLGELVEVVELETRPNPVCKAAPIARLVCLLALATLATPVLVTVALNLAAWALPVVKMALWTAPMMALQFHPAMRALWSTVWRIIQQ